LPPQRDIQNWAKQFQEERFSFFLNLALSRGKCVIDRDCDMLMRRRITMSFGDENVLMLRHCNANINLEQIALAVWRAFRFQTESPPTVRNSQN
jgi:hypothetical protein